MAEYRSARRKRNFILLMILYEIKNILNNRETSIFYESTHRIIKTLEKFKEFDHKRQIIVCRELTKKFETIYRGTVEDVLHKIETGNSKGEFVVVVHS